MNALTFVTFSKLSIVQLNSLPTRSTAMVSLTSAAVVITGCAPRNEATNLASAFAPPRCPESALMTLFALSSITSTAGSLFLSMRCGATILITAPRENIQINAS
jgi:hypothetical protein